MHQVLNNDQHLVNEELVTCLMCVLHCEDHAYAADIVQERQPLSKTEWTRVESPPEHLDCNKHALKVHLLLTTLATISACA